MCFAGVMLMAIRVIIIVIVHIVEIFRLLVITSHTFA